MSSLNMPWWKNSPGHLFFTFSSSSSSPASPSSSAAGGRNRPRDLRFFHWSRRQPRPRLTRQNNLRRLTEHEINALSIDAATSNSTTVSRWSSNLDAASSSTPVSQSPGNLDAASSSIPVSQSPSNLVAASSSSPVFRFPSNLDAASNSTPVFRYPSDLDAASSFTPVFRSSSDVDASSSSAPVSQSHSILSTASSSNPVFWSPRDLDTTLSSNPVFRSPRNLDAASSSTPVSRSPSNLDAAPLRSASSPIVLLPRPLPLPERASAVSPHRESTLGRGLGFSPPNPMGCPLPSPLRASGRSEGDDGNRATTKPTSLESVVESRLACQTNCRSPEQVDISLNKSTISDRRKVSHESNSTRTINRLNIPTRSVPISEFSSPIASPIYSPRRLSDVGVLSSVVSTPGRQVWSASEIPCMGMMTAFSSQTSPEKRMCSPERSPLCSPTTKSHILRSRNPSAPPSPLHTKMFPESSAAWHDNGGNVNVYPLPLPPGAAPSSQSAFAHQSAAKAEVSVMTNQWQKGKLIGSGTFGNVYEATNRHNGALCAMKEVNIIPDDARSAECLKQLEQEIKFLSQFKHPNIVQYYGSETIEDQLYIYLEYVHPGSISKYVRQYCGALTESVVRNFTRHILEGLIYLHSKNVVHRDIKGANLLVDVNGVVKLADFGMAKHLSGAAPALSVKGSPFWMAPEMLQATMNKEIGYDLAVDIWSLGCTIIEMFTGKHPWSGLQGHQAMFKVLHYDPPIPEKLSSEGKDFLQCCFRRNPAERPTANVLLKHPFIQNSHCYNLHCSFKDFTGIKLVDSTFSPRDRGKSKSSKSDPFMKRTRKPNGENSQCHPEISVSAGSHLSSRSTPVVFPSLSPHSSHTASSPAGASVNTQNNMQFGAGNLLPYALSKPYGKEVVHSF